MYNVIAISSFLHFRSKNAVGKNSTLELKDALSGADKNFAKEVNIHRTY